MIQYAVINSDGAVIGVEGDVETAVDTALDAEPYKTVQVQTLDEELDLEDNPPSSMVAKAARNTLLGNISEDALEMDLDEAHERLFPFFDGLTRRGGVPVKAYNNKSGMIEAWIGQNYKTAKEHPEYPSKVMGLSIVPHRLVVNMTKQRKLYGQAFTHFLKNRLPTLPDRFTFCTGSSQLCRDSCLVFAGQNSAEVYNSHRKAMQAAALLSEPEAFMRILVASIAKHQCVAPTEGYEPYMRLNVLSDIPWEEHAPWLFDHFPDLSFYDYTKIAGRRVPDNYDITFSFSGTNEALCTQELDEGRKVAVVFLAHRKRGQKWEAWKRGKEIPLPTEFWGLPVVDGDISDVRPLDETPSIVGLRWKSPSGRRAGVYVDPSAEEFTFVVPTYVVEDTLVTALTPRFESIEHDTAQPIGPVED